MKKLIIGTIALLTLSSACTPQQMATWERLTKTTITNEAKDTLSKIPDQPFNTIYGTINTDGTVTPYEIPANSKCPQWYGAAMIAGWSPDQWVRLDRIMWRESHCNPGVYNGVKRDSSYGLTQLNMKAHKKWVGPLVYGNFDSLYDPVVNLTIARQLFDMAVRSYGCGWQPWAYLTC